MTRSEILSRYRRLRQISKEQHQVVLDIIAPDVLLDWAKRIDLAQGKTVVSDGDYEIALAEDLAIYLPRLGRSHPLDRYAQVARFAPGSDEAIMLTAMRHARFSLWRVERHHETTGLILRDLLREEEIWLIDEAMAKNARPGREMAARLVQPDCFAMTARVIVPIIPDLMTRPELMEEVFTKAPALRSLQGTALAEDPRFAIGIYRAAVATGAMDFVRFKRKIGQPSAQTHSGCPAKAPKSRSGDFMAYPRNLYSCCS
jgi:hypothetical protein